jgi:putative SOS response-associated peptidase YedK
VLESWALLSSDANSLMATIHERMPIILQPSDFEAWLDHFVTDPPKTAANFSPVPS